MSEVGSAAFVKVIGSYRPAPWELIPDLGLYMDQVITYLERQYKELFGEGERIFTPAMVNNYVKMGLVDRPVGKKYGREQLAQLLMICVLKQATSAEGMKILLRREEGESLREQYAHFCALQEQAFGELARLTPLPSPMSGAVRCAAYSFLCGAVLARGGQAPEPEEEAQA